MKSINEVLNILEKLIDREQRYLKDAIEREDEDDARIHHTKSIAFNEVKRSP